MSEVKTIAYVEGQHNKISAIVDHVMFKKTLPDQWFQWFLEMALWDLRELRLDVWADVKTELLPVTDRRTVILPSCYVAWTKVACRVGQYYVTLGVNDKLNTLDRDPANLQFVQGLLSQNLPNGLNFNAYSGYYFFNYGGATLQAYSGGFITKGSFREHFNGVVKELLLDYDYLHDHVYLEYITDGFDPCGETVVDPYFADYLKKCMEFHWEEEKEPNRTEASIARRGRSMRDAYWVVKGRKNDLDPKTLLNISRSGTRLTPHI